MKRQIRYGVFETNSSSSHSLVIIKGETFDKLKNGHFKLKYKWKFNDHEDVIIGKIYNKEEALQLREHCLYKNDTDDYYLTNYFISYDYDYIDDYTEVLIEEVGSGENRYVAVSTYSQE